MPLSSEISSPTSGDLSESILAASDDNIKYFSSGREWIKNYHKIKKVASYNSTALEVVTSTENFAEGVFFLQNQNADQIVDRTYTRFGSEDVQISQVFFDEQSEGFTTEDNGSSYKIGLKCEFNCEEGVVKIHKAALWIEVKNLSAASLTVRLASEQSESFSAETYSLGGYNLDLSRLSLSKLTYDSTVEDHLGSTAEVSLIRFNSFNSPGAGVVVNGSQLMFDTDSVFKYTSLDLSPELTSGFYSLDFETFDGPATLMGGFLHLELGKQD